MDEWGRLGMRKAIHLTFLLVRYLKEEKNEMLEIYKQEEKKNKKVGIQENFTPF